MKENNIKDLVAVDLHVHTPESKCYVIDENIDIDDEYIALLEKYVEKNIKVIAITDHNSINGYKKLMQMKKDSQERIKIWKELSHIEDVKKKIDIENYKLDLFNNISILPGVEFEANPGVHIILIFNPKEEIDIIENFLVENGYPKEVQGIESPEISKKSAIDIIESAKELGAITIAAHVESSKGALQNIPKGKARAQFFKSESLMGIQVVSLNKIDYLKELYKSAEYKRDKLPAFIRCSDFHNKDEDIEKCATYMRLSDFKFESVKEAIINNTECISFTRFPANDDIIRNVIDQNKTYTLKNLSEDSSNNLKKYICCILNSGSGNIVIGVGENNSIVGIKDSKEKFEKFIKEAIKSYKEFQAFFRYRVQYYEYGNHLVVVLSIRSMKKIIYNFEGKVFLKKDNNIVEASPSDLVKIGEDNFKKCFREINNRNKHVINKISKELNRIKLLENNINLYSKINNISLKLEDIANIDILEPTIEGVGQIISCMPGKNYGNIYAVHSGLYNGPHNKDCYIRVTCPRTDVIEGKLDSKEYDNECILILITGTTHYIEGKEKYKIATKLPIFRVELKDEFKEVCSLKSIVSWLKSPILLSFLDLIYGSCDLFNPKILYNIPILMNEITKKNGKLDEFVDGIIDREYKFLYKFNQLRTEQVDEEVIDEIIEQHNIDIAVEARNIEKYIKELLDIEDEEYNIINEFIVDMLWSTIFIDKDI